MDLWNEYEGKTIAERYPLEKLIHPEGRSGFFLTSNGSGAPAVIRLTETMNDETEILSQWQAVVALKHPNLIAMKSYGETVVDQVPLIFAVMERPDATLAEILLDRPMTTDETRQIAISVATALKSLHQNGLVHRHLDASSVAAVGETIKLRSDCVRRISESDEAAKLKAEDVRDLSALLLECLTQRRSQPGELPLLPTLPAPFDRIVLDGLNDAGSLDGIHEALEPASPAAPPPVARGASGETPIVPAITPAATPPSRRPGVPKDPVSTPSFVEPQSSSSVSPAGSRRFLIAAVSIAVLIALLVAVRVRSRNSQAANSQTSVSTMNPLVAAPSNSSAAPATGKDSNASAVPGSAATWRVVAYSFRRDDEARKKSEALLRRHPLIDPEIITRSGREPYLVTLGGAMTREAALAFQQKLRAQHFSRPVHLQEIGAK